MTAAECKVLVGTLKAGHPRQEVNQETLELFVAQLADLPRDRAERAVLTLLRTSRFFPTIAEIRLRVADEFLGAPSPAAAFELAASPRYSRTSAHPLVGRAREIVGGSWEFKTTENYGVLRSNFLRAYTDLRDDALRGIAAKRWELAQDVYGPLAAGQPPAAIAERPAG